MIREIDSSLIDEWERMQNPASFAEKQAEAEAQAERERLLDAQDVTRNSRAFTVMMRNESFRLVRALARGDLMGAIEILGPTSTDAAPWTEERLRARLDAYTESGHSKIRYDGAARSPSYTRLQPDTGGWNFTQILLDPEGHQDWALLLRVERDASRIAGKPALTLLDIASL